MTSLRCPACGESNASKEELVDHMLDHTAGELLPKLVEYHGLALTFARSLQQLHDFEFMQHSLHQKCEPEKLATCLAKQWIKDGAR